MDKYKQNREFMMSNFDVIDSELTDQGRKLPQPPLQKPYDKEGIIIKLPTVDKTIAGDKNTYSILADRRSKRKYNDEYLSLMELSYLLWATQGVDKVLNNSYATLRPAPSGGARHPFETYLIINNVEGIESGIYRYLALTHELLFLFKNDNIKEEVTKFTFGQSFVANGAVTFIWSCVPYRGEWRYDVAAHKTMLLDAGHMCQNLYIACESVGCGTCAIGAYDQKAVDSFLGLDGEDEFVIYMAPVGKI